MKNFSKYLSIAVLIIVNLTPLYGVLLLSWDFSNLALVYIIELFIIGLYSFLKSIILLVKEKQINLKIISTVIILNTGSLLVAYGIMKVVFYFIEFPEISSSIIAVSIILAFSHTLSFFVNFIFMKEYLKLKILDQELVYLARIGVLFMPIVMSIFVFTMLGPFIATGTFLHQVTTGMLIVLVFSKLIFDIIGHEHEHAKIFEYSVRVIKDFAIMTLIFVMAIIIGLFAIYAH